MDGLAARFAPMNIFDNSQQSCDRLCCSSMVHYQELPSSSVPDLSNDIHPVFRQENFSSALQYDVLVPALRLATHFLLSNSAIVYINAIFGGIIRDPLGAVCTIPTYEEMARRGGFWSIWPHPGMDNLTDETKQKSMQILYLMADMVTFTTKDLGNNGTRGQCVAPNVIDLRPPSMVFRGVRCRIELSTKEYDTLALLTRQHMSNMSRHSQTTQPSLALMEKSFDVARNLVHEFSHALGFAAHGLIPRELCYKDTVMAEAGFEFEAQVFGCLINSVDNRLADMPHRESHNRFVKSSMLIATEWPSPQRAMLYLKANSTEIYTGGPLPNYELAWRVPYSFLSDLFTNHFWNIHHSRQDSRPVPVPTVGSCVWWVPEPQLSLDDFENHPRLFRKRHFGAV